LKDMITIYFENVIWETC